MPDTAQQPASREPAGADAEPRARLFAEVQREPWAFDFFALLRQVENQSPRQPRLGAALRPSAESLRLGQDIELDFAPAALSSLQPRGAAPPRLGVRFFGLFGPMGPLPLHLSEYARDRLRNHADPTLARFADIFHHRALLLFYRAWAMAQPVVQADRPDDDAFAKWLSALFGQAPPALRGGDSVRDSAKRHVAAHLARPARNAESLVKVLRQYFGVPVQVQTNVGHWMVLRAQDRSRLGQLGTRLGRSAVAGAKVWDRQYKLRVQLGALTLQQYRRFLPGQPALRELRDWMRQLLGFEYAWDVQLMLRGAEVPALQIGRSTAGPCALGHDTWLGHRAPHADRGDLHLHSSRFDRSPPTPQESRHG